MQKFNTKNLILIFFLCIFSSLNCSKQSSDKNNDEVNFYTVKDVIDGDTIVLNDEQRVRYIGMNTPEISILEQKQYAEKATEENKNLVLNKKVKLVYDVEKKDKYGRTLAYVFIDDVMINKELVRLGWALVDTFPPNIAYYKEFVNAEQEASQNIRGFWSSQSITPIDQIEAEKYIGEFKVVEGTVISVHKGKSILLLNFGKDYKTDFTIAIYKSNFKLFKNENIDPETYYLNKKVRTFGWINKYNGPQIEVDNPFQIEVVK